MKVLSLIFEFVIDNVIAFCYHDYWMKIQFCGCFPMGSKPLNLSCETGKVKIDMKIIILLIYT